jgi:acyl-CoA synthetase (AMP-forming)/AMP-acid ligase II
VDAYGLGVDDKALCVLPMTNINGMVTTLLAPLISGGKVHFFQGAFFEAAAEAIDNAVENGCNWMSAIPMHYSVLASMKEECRIRSFVFCRSAASALPARTFKAFESRYGLPLVESLGMTETAGQIFTNGKGSGERLAGSVGKPFNFQARIVDDCGVPLPGDQVGNVEVKGEAMMLGYLDDIEGTDRTLEQGWLKTGDLARLDAQGNFIFEGRKKQIAIFGGVNISLGNLEKVIKDVWGINDVVCLSSQHELFGEVINVFIQVSGDFPEQARDEIKSIVRKALVPHVPSLGAIKRINIVHDFPRTGVGKIDRKKCQIDLIENAQ